MATVFFALDAGFLATVFFAFALVAGFLATVFFALDAGFLATAFLTADFFTDFLATVFFAADDLVFLIVIDKIEWGVIY